MNFSCPNLLVGGSNASSWHESKRWDENPEIYEMILELFYLVEKKKENPFSFLCMRLIFFKNPPRHSWKRLSLRSVFCFFNDFILDFSVLGNANVKITSTTLCVTLVNR